ncbi:hypothetical protein FRC08_001013 [Ceratobasidium sp. 394]|nr:hypothetical protein FRC08_001013 [Ceratobasidium sp. 394]
MLEDIFAGREDIMIGEELQKAIDDHASQVPLSRSILLASPTPAPTPAHTPTPPCSSIAGAAYASQSLQASQNNYQHAHGTSSYILTSPVTQPAPSFPKEPVWPAAQHQSPRPHRLLTKGSVANVLRRHGVAEEATRRFHSFQASSGGTPAFELDVAYELQTKLRAHIRQLEYNMFEREDSSPRQSTSTESWY